MNRRQDIIASPFGTLIAHFVKRLFASEEEQGSGSSMGFGVGAILAIAASPGAFASIFLMGKYSTLLQWMRGEHVDAIRRSPSDEYFFIVLSMTITGLVLVARWNRLFPDRRDFSNLAILPIPISHIFLANLAALLGLAVVFGVVVNGVSVLLFPFFVTISIGTLAAFATVGFAHALAVLSASFFSFFGVFALVGLLTLVLPRALFRPVSVAFRILLVVALLTEFFSNIVVRLFAGNAPSSAATYWHWIPSFWFLGLYESMLGIAKPAMQPMAERAGMGLAVAVAVAVAAYAVCYRRVFLRLPESFDIMTRSRSFFRIRFPEMLLAPLFRSPFERACSTFAAKVLLRSEQHLMFFGAYLGIGLVFVAETSLGDKVLSPPGGLPEVNALAIPLLIAFFITSGLRFVFDLPAAPEGNWIFRTGSNHPEPSPRSIARRLLLWATLPWQLCVLLPLTTSRWGWSVALAHVAAVLALTVFFTDLLLLNFCKIPFTCLWQIDIKRMLVRMLATLFGVVAIVPALAAIERSLLTSPLRFTLLLAVLGCGWFWISKHNRAAAHDEVPLFDDSPGPPFELLKLT